MISFATGYSDSAGSGSSDFADISLAGTAERRPPMSELFRADCSLQFADQDVDVGRLRSM